MSTEKVNAYDVVFQQIEQAMEQGNLAWKHYSQSSAAKNPTTDKRYSGANQLVLSLVAGMSGYKSNYWAGFTQWDAIGASVKEGQKATKILRPLFRKSKNEGAEDQLQIIGVKYENVFNADQVEGFESDMPLAKSFTSLEKIENAERIVNSMPQKPEIRHKGPNSAFYSILTDSVTMPVQYTCGSEEYYSVLFHELAHSTGAKHRLNRESLQKIQGFGTHEYSKEELVAEITAAILCNESGILDKTINNSAAYCKSWLKRLRDDKKMLFWAANEAFKASNFILGVK